MATSRILGRDRMRKVLKALPEAIRKRLREAILSESEAMAGMMRSIVPVDRGDLKKSIKVTPGDEAPALYARVRSRRAEKDPYLAAIVHADDFKARFVEFGTAPHVNQGQFTGTMNPGTPAQPFFFPSFRAHRKKAQSRINKAARQGIKDGLK